MSCIKEMMMMMIMIIMMMIIIIKYSVSVIIAAQNQVLQTE